MTTVKMKYEEVNDFNTFKYKLGLSDLKSYPYTATESHLIEYGRLDVIFASYKSGKLQYVYNTKQSEMIAIDYDV